MSKTALRPQGRAQCGAPLRWSHLQPLHRREERFEAYDHEEEFTAPAQRSDLNFKPGKRFLLQGMPMVG